jgi:hypothetical protein
MHILSTIKSYYEKLYTTKYPDENLTSNYIFDTKLENRLQDQDQSICDGKVTEEQCSNAINNIDNYRPISLLNVDLKLLSYVLAHKEINRDLCINRDDWQNPIFAQWVISLNLVLAGLRLSFSNKSSGVVFNCA